ncbi:MAG: PspC domain-containing protein [Firmicutes bacterium]|nr:PspC domain-containing protein [Bacillota bacterium]HPU01242.1 PspC domain-containing protein [Bacillota bacterium]
MEPKRLYRSRRNCMIAGVCGGLAEYLNLDPTVVRLIYVILTLFSAAFPGLLLYIIAAIIMPQEDQ